MSHHDTLTSRVLLAGEPAIGVVEITLPPAWDGPPLHHHDFDETFHVLEGELTLLVGDEVVTAAPGSTTVASRGIHHTVANLSDAPARYLLVCTPGGFERMFARLEAMRPYPETTMVGPTLFAYLGRQGCTRLADS
jgi:quercetin dioxygenase-like cupin family protein